MVLLPLLRPYYHTIVDKNNYLFLCHRMLQEKKDFLTFQSFEEGCCTGKKLILHRNGTTFYKNVTHAKTVLNLYYVMPVDWILKEYTPKVEATYAAIP